VQVLPSLQSATVTQQPATAACVHALVVVLHASLVQTFASLQSAAVVQQPAVAA
jgi:hypothetical protein